MTQIHTCYEVSKRLKEFLGESAPEPMGKMYWNTDGPTRGMGAGQGTPICFGALGFKNGDKYTYPAYCLHDLLSKPFCEAMAHNDAKIEGPINYGEDEHSTCDPSESHSYGVAIDIFNAYYGGGMEAVEKALLALMEEK